MSDLQAVCEDTIDDMREMEDACSYAPLFALSSSIPRQLRRQEQLSSEEKLLIAMNKRPTHPLNQPSTRGTLVFSGGNACPACLAKSLAANPFATGCNTKGRNVLGCIQEFQLSPRNRMLHDATPNRAPGGILHRANGFGRHIFQVPVASRRPPGPALD